MLDESMPTSDCTAGQFRQPELSAYNCAALPEGSISRVLDESFSANKCSALLCFQVRSFAGTSLRNSFQDRRFQAQNFQTSSFRTNRVSTRSFHNRFRSTSFSNSISSSMHNTNFDDSFDYDDDSFADRLSQADPPHQSTQKA